MGQPLLVGQKERKSNIELLRIVAMIIIVAHHFAVHSSFDFSTQTVIINKLWIQFVEIGGKIGVDIFVLISGYFLISTKSTNIAKSLKIWLQILFYSITIYFIFVIAGTESFDVKEFVKNILPITFSKWWFASACFVLYILSPFINSMIKSFDKRRYIAFLLLLAFCWCIIPTFTGRAFESNSLLWFVFLYSLAGYIKLFDCRISLTAVKLILYAVLCTLLTFASVVLFDLIGTKIQFFALHATFFYSMQKLPILIISLFIFLGFLKLNIGYNRIINIVASASFGVYLIHDNRYVRNWLWDNVFKTVSYAESNMLVLYSILIIAIVFICCTIVELLRIYLIEKHYLSAVNKFAEFIEKVKNYVIDKIVKIL